jgi:hypothetical protein
VGETRVDLQHLLEDLRDAYTGAIEETILTEVVANALDSGATRIRLFASPADATLTIVDDGRGMQRRELARYHDVAASTKARGEGIGFAGVGIKLGLLVSREVITETRRGATRVATRWHLASRHRAPWKWIPPPGLTDTRGTAVQLRLTNPLSPLVDAGYLEETVRRHFEPLIDPAFDELLRRHYAAGVTFEVDQREIARLGLPGTDRAPIAIRIGRRRIPAVIGYLERAPALAADRDGIAISTFGKVIKRGWDWLGLAQAARAGVSGLIEAPDLSACLTLSKNDFVRSGTRGATYLTYRKAIQEVVSRQLAAWGDPRDSEARPRTIRLERDLERVLEGLADDFPLLRSLVDRRAGGQKRLPMPGRGEERVPAPLVATVPAGLDGDLSDTRLPAAEATAAPITPNGSEPSEREPGPDAPEGRPPVSDHALPNGLPAAEGGEPSPIDSTSTATLNTVRGRRRPARYGLLVQFESRPDDVDLAHLVDSTIWINDAHPAYKRATASRSLGYHTALAVALALAPLAVEAANEHAFITQFLAHWGGSDAPATRRLPDRRRRAERR